MKKDTPMTKCSLILRKVSEVALFLSGSLAIAVPIAKLDVPHLVEKADVIVVARVGSLNRVGNRNFLFGDALVSADLISTTLAVEEVIKGVVPASPIILEYAVPGENIGYRTVAQGQYAVFFLRTDGGKYALSDVNYPFLPASPGTRSSGGAPPLERIVQQEKGVLSSPDITSFDKQSSIVALKTIRQASSINALKLAMTTSDQAVRLQAAGALLSMGDNAGFRMVTAALLRQPPLVNDVVLHNLRVGVREAATTEAELHELAALMQSPNAETRRAAIESVGRIDSAATLDPLQAALQDSDKEVRYFAVIGLADRFGNIKQRPTRMEFDTDEERYVSFWRKWANAER